MPASRTARRAGQFCTGLGALIVLIGLLVGAPLALLTLAGNPLPDHVPSVDEISSALTSRDDGRLFLRTLAVVGWAGWATFALSVLVEVPARILRRPAIRLPGLGRQQRWAATLIGSVALVIAVSPAATAASAVATTTVSAPALPAAPVVAAAPFLTGQPAAAGLPVAAEPASGPAPHWLVAPSKDPAAEPVPVYRVEKGDYLGHIAGRYLGDFDRYPELARLNKIRDPDRIRPGQFLHLPPAAEDGGVRQHATGLVAVPPPPGGWPQVAPDGSVPQVEQPDGAAPPQNAVPRSTGPTAGPQQPVAPRQSVAPQQSETPLRSAAPERTVAPQGSATPGRPVAPQASATPQRPAGSPEPAVPVPAQPGNGADDDDATYTISASRAGPVDDLNRPLAVSAVIAVASIVGAQIGAVFGLRGRSGRRPPIGNGRHRLRG
ncbi:LysM peptidoglycan-binding domain-containing protein [Plantactinospora soyae]|uniref:LysM repeat protein n=1 Tax=Plantactinospora soyae TaxID=1544732 RepID=A0A927R5D6_9ACTN|nr:LysM peptidoglycan-binding domain-containing protein [Plantactinospora soyae]MBE1485836.1 LysM repeat protein [Plantactinospora soyae]